MKTLSNITLHNVQDVYNGPEGDLWELIMGEQIHVGGLSSSMNLAAKADLKPGSKGVDFCCCNGAGMRFLIQFKQIASMTGVDATEKVIQRAKSRCHKTGFENKTSFVLADVCSNGLPDNNFDFSWGEDAWCYVIDKEKLISEAVRIVKSGGKIAFTDWVEGENLSNDEAQRFMRFMKFPNIFKIEEYTELLKTKNCEIIFAENTGIFAEYVDLYLDMLNKQLTYDALKLIGFNMDAMAEMGAEMAFMQQLAHEGKIAQAMLIAKKK